MGVKKNNRRAFVDLVKRFLRVREIFFVKFLLLGNVIQTENEIFELRIKSVSEALIECHIFSVRQKRMRDIRIR